MTDAPPDYPWRNYNAAQRVAEAVRLHQSVLSTDEILAGRFIAVRLADGGSDGVAYDTREAAVRAQTNSPSRHAYLQIPLESMSAQVCDVMLWYVRQAYDNGWREDPAFALMLPTRMEDVR